MSGTWPLARAALQAKLNGLQVTSTERQTETLQALEYSPAGRQDVLQWPYAFILPFAQHVRRLPPYQRIVEGQPVVRMMLAPMNQTEEMQVLQQRYDAWLEVLKDAFDSGIALGGAADVASTEQDFSGLILFEEIDTGWGFDMTLGQFRLSESKTFTA